MGKVHSCSYCFDVDYIHSYWHHHHHHHHQHHHRSIVISHFTFLAIHQLKYCLQCGTYSIEQCHIEASILTIGPFIFDCAYQKPKVVYWQWIVVVVLTILIIIVLIFHRVVGSAEERRVTKMNREDDDQFPYDALLRCRGRERSKNAWLNRSKWNTYRPLFSSTNTRARLRSHTNTQLNNYCRPSRIAIYSQRKHFYQFPFYSV